MTEREIHLSKEKTKKGIYGVFKVFNRREKSHLKRMEKSNGNS